MPEDVFTREQRHRFVTMMMNDLCLRSIECRGAERFGLLARELEDETMRAFYARLWKAELKHGHLFVHLLLKEFDEQLIYPRLHELLELEATIVTNLEYRPALH